MAETLTYDPGTSEETSVDNLSQEEQESLKVGEQLVEQQEQLLAGKYKDAEELEKAYVELQKKLGEKGTEDSEEVRDTESSDKETDTEEEKETEEDVEYYLEDGKVNYEAVNDAYGEKLGDIFKDSEVDPWSINKHFHENEGTITDDMYKSLEDAGLSRSSIDAYLAGRAVESGYTQVEGNDISDSQVNQIKTFAGGEEAYNNLVTWAGQNLDPEAIDAFDSIVTNGSIQAIELAVSGLKSQYEASNGYEGKMYSGKAAKGGTDVFRSQAELVAAMGDPRYDRDPAYRQDIINKLERSDNLQF